MVRKPKIADQPIETQADAAAALASTDAPIADGTISESVAPEAAPFVATPVANPTVARAGHGKMLALGAGLGIVAAALGYGAALQFPLAQFAPQSPTQAPAPAVDLSPLIDRIAALETQTPISDPAIALRLDALEQIAPPDLAAIEARMAAIEARIDGLGTTDDLRAEVAAIKQQVAQTDPAPAIKAAIDAEMVAVQKAAADMQLAVDAAAQQAAASSAMTLLRAALDTGAPFVAAAGVLDLPAPLLDYAKTGLPSLTRLKDTFPAAARAGLDAALRDNLGASWAERVANFLRSQTGARSLTPQTGSDPDAILSRIDAALQAADMPAVMAEIFALPTPAKTAMADWIAQARARANGLAAFETLAEKGQ